MAHLLLASIHDVSPRFEGEIDRLVGLIEPHVGEKIAMLVVPNHWNEAPIIPGSAFAARLRAWSDAGFEMFLHGLVHRDGARHKGRAKLRARVMTAGEGEFLGLSRTQAVDRIIAGRSLVEDVIGTKIAGFVAPAWLYGPGALEALGDCAIPIAEDHWRIWSPATGAQLARGPVITWASRTPLRLASSLVASTLLQRSPQRVLRIAVHPPDCRQPSLVSSIERAFRTAMNGRSAARYTDLTIKK